VNYKPTLNKVTEPEAHALPRIDETLSLFNGSLFFSSVDMVDAFYQIPLAPESRDLTAFTDSTGSVYRYTRLPQGCKQGPSVFSKFVSRVLQGMRYSTIAVYLDDIACFTPSYDTHVKALNALFTRMHDYGLSFRADKCHFFAKEFVFLGHVISDQGVAVDPRKTKAIDEMELPADPKCLKSVLGLFSYYRKYVKDYARKVEPLQNMIKKDAIFKRDETGKAIYTKEQIASFEEIKLELVSPPILGHPHWDEPFEVHTDACNHGLGAVLVQVIDNKEHVIQFASRALKEGEFKWSIWEKEFLAIVWAVQLFDTYLRPPFGRQFIIRTDNEAVKFIMTNKQGNHRVMRWILQMGVYDYEVLHRAGSKSGNADGLSRCHLPDSSPYNCHVEGLYDRDQQPIPMTDCSQMGTTSACAVRVLPPSKTHSIQA
jgi:hypothetical protein